MRRRMDRGFRAQERAILSATLLASKEELDAVEVWVQGDRFHHLFRARRLRRGEAVRLTDGGGRARWAEVREVGAERARLVLGSAAPTNESPIGVHLAVATPRAARTSWQVEKGTELGVVSFRFFSCERAPRRIHAAGVKRLQRVAAAALEQSGRSLLPFIEAGLDLAALEEHLRSCERSVLLDPHAQSSLVRVAGGSWWVVVGPEGGFTPAEGVRLQAATTVSARLGPSILRVETAALAASSLLLFGSHAHVATTALF